MGAGLRASGVTARRGLHHHEVPGRRPAAARHAQESLEALGTDRVDLWLIHWPTDGGAGVRPVGQSLATRPTGLARAIGVSNYSLDMVDELDAATGVTPGGEPDRVEPAAVRPRRRRRATASAASCSRATAPYAAGRSSTRSSTGSPSGTGRRRRR